MKDYKKGDYKIEKENKTVRVGVRFNKAIEKIRDTRKKEKRDKVKKSAREITDMIVRHKGWPQIEEEIINAEQWEFKTNGE